MKFLVDAQLPRRMILWFVAAGCEALHTFDLPGGNCTPDDKLVEIANRDEHIFVTKDGDFVNSHFCFWVNLQSSCW